MKHGSAGPTVQAEFTGTYKAFNSSEQEITGTADVRFWLDKEWSGNDYGGNASDVVGKWSDSDPNGINLRTDDNVAYVDVLYNVATWARIFTS